MITEDYVSFETAKLLKEKGFQAKCTACYHDSDHTLELISGRINFCNPRFKRYKGIPPYNAPTLQMAMKWLREVHNYDISICLDSYVEPYDNQYYIVIRRKKDKYENISPCEQVYFDTYEEACEAAIKYCLENLI